MIKLKNSVQDNFFTEESREIVINARTKKIWAVELDLLSEFHQVCEKLGLKYSIAYGTLLGAVRHKGFIPWDNDVDVVMLREDYEKLCAVAQHEFRSPYFFQTSESDPWSLRGHAQLRNSETTGILRSEFRNGKSLYPFNQGIFMDIFPLDYLPDDDNQCDEFLAEVKKLKINLSKLRYRLAAFKNRKIINMGRLSILFGAMLTLKNISSECILLRKESYKLERLCKKYLNTESSRVSVVSFSPEMAQKSKFDHNLFTDLIDIEFENIVVKAPRKYYEILRVLYGNWKEHVVGFDSHGGVFFNVDKPYREYLI